MHGRKWTTPPRLRVEDTKRVLAANVPPCAHVESQLGLESRQVTRLDQDGNVDIPTPSLQTALLDRCSPERGH